MCGIVGLYIKSEDLKPSLGELFSPMLIEMSDRGPDSAGIAIFRNRSSEGYKLTLFSPDTDYVWKNLSDHLTSVLGNQIGITVNNSHCVITFNTNPEICARVVKSYDTNLQVMSIGKSMEIYKETGKPEDVVESFGINEMSGSHAIGHTRMATESAVTTAGSHPFSTGTDICLVHNGSLSNHNRLRNQLVRDAKINFETENDTEVAAAYITHRMANGLQLSDALEDCIDDLDGFYTFVVGTKKGFAALRDPIACKPAVLAETNDYVAFGSEYRALAKLPGISDAKVWEPEPAIVYSWGDR